jgi:hypothetical protein
VKFVDANTGIANDENYNPIRLQQEGNIINLDPLFENPNRNKLRIDQNSPAVSAGNESYRVAKDILGVLRELLSAPDLGAYQHVISD